MAGEVTYPVQVLREHTVALEAALSVCLAKPAQKPVHHLRTETRRVEAQLLLLAQVPEMPEHHDEADRLRRSLRRLRRAAGAVRDLDVHRERLQEIAEAAGGASEVQETAVLRTGRQRRKASKNAGQAAAALSMQPVSKPAQDALAKGATALRDHLKPKRDEAAGDLQTLLKKHQAKAAGKAEGLLKVLARAEDFALSSEDLQRYAQAVLLRGGLLTRDGLKNLAEDELHSVRKAAKAARYLAETVPGNTEVAASARRFETLQDAGGKWHDALDLARLAKRFLGKTHELTVAIAGERDEHLEAYRQELKKAVQASRPAKKRPGAGFEA